MEDQNRSFTQQLKYLWDESLARHVIVRRNEQKPVDLPLLVVIIAAIVAPWLVAGGAIVALVMSYRIEMTRPGSDDLADAATSVADAAEEAATHAGEAVEDAADALTGEEPPAEPRE